MTTETKNTAIVYERQPCGRCGGSGRYSFNQIDGDRCYGCGGTGQKLTKRGAAAYAFASELLDVPVEEFFDKHNGERSAVYRDAFAGRKVTFRKLQETERTMIKPGMGKPEQAHRSFKIVSDVERINGMGFGQGIRVRLIPTEADVETVMAYQESLTKAGKPRKR